uniref:Uncharacterized protein n=1 Tax=Avena sativa TaxID=4498 RepID=A0ACD5VYP6_AVESA
MAAVEAGGGIGLMSGTVSIPDCRAVRRNGTTVVGSEKLFAMSCPLSGPTVPKDTKGLRLVGAAVFNMNGLVIGTVDHVDPASPDIKYARRTNSFLNSLEHLLIKFDNTICLSKGEQRGVTAGAGTSERRETTTGSGSKKRGRDDLSSGSTSTKGGLCMDHLKLNVVMASEENSRLHMFPLQGDMDLGRRESKRRELVRLVTREPDGRWTGSPSSHGLPSRSEGGEVTEE